MKTSVLVIGLGRFGASAARELMALGHEVLAVDQRRGDRQRDRAGRDPRRAARRRRPEAAQGNRRRPSSSTRSSRSRPGRGERVRGHGAQAAWRGQRHREGRPPLTARSSSGWARAGSSSPSGRWASGSPTRSPLGRHRVLRRRARFRHRHGRVPPLGGAPPRRDDWAHVPADAGRASPRRPPHGQTVARRGGPGGARR